MPLPRPEPGLVISYAYLWLAEHEQGREEGAKDRPSVVIMAVDESGGRTVVTVAPVTHTPPAWPEEAVEIPLATKQRLGLDEARSWVMVSEVNRFAWPGPDVRPIAAERFDYGVLPPNLFRQIRDRIGAVATKQRLAVVPRSE